MSDKKRSTYNPGDKLKMPEHLLDRKKYGYRWVRATAFSENSYDYEPRGYEKAKSPTGEIIKSGDLILAQMPVDMYEARKESIEQARLDQIERLQENQKSEHDMIRHAVKKAGGKIKIETSN
jgi:hypothetical protein